MAWDPVRNQRRIGSVWLWGLGADREKLHAAGLQGGPPVATAATYSLEVGNLSLACCSDKGDAQAAFASSCIGADLFRARTATQDAERYGRLVRQFGAGTPAKGTVRFHQVRDAMHD
jgi:hypothetical protein